MKTGPNRGFPPPPPRPSQPQQRGRYVPTAQRPGSSHAPPPPPNDHPKPTKSWDKFPQTGFPGMNRTQTRKHGFDPTTPGEDEHMAGTSAYAGVHRTHARNSYFDTATSAASDNEANKNNPPSPLRHSKSHETPSARPGLERQSTRYVAGGGERTSLNTGGLGRSASVRNSPVDPKYEDRANRTHGTTRFRSASPGLNRARAEASYSPDSTSSESSTEEEIEVKPRSRATARGHTRNKTVPNHWNHETHENNLHSPQQDHTAKYQYPPPPPRNSPFFPKSTARAGDSHTNHSTRPAGSASEEETSKYELPSLSDSMKSSQKCEGNPKSGSCAFHSERPAFSLLVSQAPFQKPDSSPLSSELRTVFQETCARVRRDKIRVLDMPSSLFPEKLYYTLADPLKPHSLTSAMNDLPKAFSASAWDGKIGPDHFTPVPEENRRSPSKTTRKGTTQTRGRTNSPDKYYDSGASAGPNQAQPSSANAFQPAKFDADKWQQQLYTSNWAAPTPEAGSSKTPKRNGRSASTARKPYNYPKPPQVVIDDSSDSSAAPPKSAPSKSTVTDEMDIDTPGQQTPQNEPVPNGHGATSTRRSDPGPTGVNLEDLQQVHPFKPSKTGLGDLADLSTTLPFESRPSRDFDLSTTTPNTFAVVKNLQLPKPPKTPIAPMEDPLPPARWVSYVTSMSAYMKEWSAFNKRILEHFSIRQARLDHNMAKNWIDAVGDGPDEIDITNPSKDHNNQTGSGLGTNNAGYKTYLTWVEQDAVIREWWNVACEKHGVAVRELGIVRDKMKKGNTLVR